MAKRYKGRSVARQQVTGPYWNITVLTEEHGELPGVIELWKRDDGFVYRVLAHVDEQTDLIIEYRSGLTAAEVNVKMRYWKS